MNVSLTPHLEAFVQGKVKSGRYTSSSEVVREALRLLEDREGVRQRALDELNAGLLEASTSLDRGEGAEWDPEAIKREGRERLGASHADA